MDFAQYRLILKRCPNLDTEQGRQHFVKVAGEFYRSASAITPYEQMLLDQFVRGNLTFDQVQAY